MSIPSGSTCPNGHTITPSSYFCPICGLTLESSNKLPTPQAFADGPSTLTLPRATAGARFIEWLIDYGAGIMISIITAGIGLFLFVVFFFANAWCEGEYGQTLGKKAMKLYVIDAQTGSFIGGARGIGRHLLHVLDGLPLGLGYIVGLATGRTFADRIMNTVVVVGRR